MKMAFAFLILLIIAAMVPCAALSERAEVDLDLSAMPASIAYAQALAIQREPGEYAGQTLRISGIFNYSEVRQQGVVIIADNTGCCETSMDFTCAGAPAYPDDYPELYARFTVVGRLEPGEEEGLCFLTDAVIEAE